MKLKNFEISDDYIEILFEGGRLDLHNCYRMESFEYVFSEQIFKLKFRLFDQQEKQNPQRFELVFSNVGFLRIHERDSEMHESDDDCLDSIGFLPIESREIMNGFLTNMPKSGTDDLIIITHTGQAIKLQCEAAEFVLLDNKK